jgi:hypothetical protein
MHWSKHGDGIEGNRLRERSERLDTKREDKSWEEVKGYGQAGKQNGRNKLHCLTLKRSSRRNVFGIVQTKNSFSGIKSNSEPVESGAESWYLDFQALFNHPSDIWL